MSLQPNKKGMRSPVAKQYNRFPVTQGSEDIIPWSPLFVQQQKAGFLYAGEAAQWAAGGTINGTVSFNGADVITATETVVDTGITSVTANNGLSANVADRSLTLGINSISTDLLVNGTNTLVLNCGTSAI